MQPATTLISVGLMAGAVLAAPHKLSARAPGGDVAVYWGQNSVAASENNDLSTYCSDAGIDIVIMAFLDEWGQTGTIPAGTIGLDCTISTTGEASDCDDLATQITTCQDNGVTVILSLGGSVGAYSLESEEQAEEIGQYLWDAYGGVTDANSSVTRPFGDAFVNGFDLDIEASSGNEYYEYMISTLRTNFETDSDNTYYITGAPQCVIPEPNMGEIITAAQFDYLWVQFYNNQDCSYPNTLNYDDWVTYISGTPSEDAKIFMGVPASTLASTGTTSGEAYYMTPAELATEVADFDTSSNWGGIMMWDAAFSDANVIDDCTYAEQAASILETGSPCGGTTGTTGTTTTTSTVPTATATSTSTSTTTTAVATSTATGTPVAEWGQVSTCSAVSCF
jgi:chitinase